MSVTARNIRLFYWDVACFGVLFGVTSNFLAIFVARLDPSPLLLSAVTSGPALINIAAQLPAVGFVERALSKKRLVVQSSLWLRCPYLLMVLVPLLVPRPWQGYAIVGVVLFQALPTSVLVLAFATLFTELVPRRQLGRVVGMQNALQGITVTAMAALCGLLLSVLPFPWGYQLILLIGFVFSLGSSWALSRLHVDEHAAPSKTHAVAHDAPRPPGLHRDRNFVRFVAASALLYMGMFMSAPLFPLYWLQTLHLSDGWIGSFATILSLATIAGAYGMRVFGQRLRISHILGGGAILFGLYPILVSGLRSPFAIAAVAGFSGIWAGVLAVGLFNALAEVSPEHDRPRYMGIFTWLMNMAIFAGPLLGAEVARVAGVGPALMLAGILRVLGGILFIVLPFVAWEQPAPVVLTPILH